MRDTSNYPKEWKTNKNLRYWLSQQNGEIITMPDDIHVHESLVVDFAKQFHQKEIDELHQKFEVSNQQLELGGKLNNDLHKEIEELNQNITVYNQQLYFYGKLNNDLYMEIDELKKQLEDARKVVEFYGNIENWERMIEMASGKQIDLGWASNLKIQDCAMYNCGGGRARMFLKKYEVSK